MRYHFTPIRMAIIKKVITSVTEDGEIGTYIHSWWVCKDTEWLLWKTIWQFLKRLSTELTYDPGILSLSRIQEMCSVTLCNPMADSLQPHGL